MCISIQENVPLKRYTTFKIGGPAKYFIEAKTREELIAAYNYGRFRKLPIFIFGYGSNLLISDEGFNGLVIKISLNRVQYDGEVIVAESGALMSKLAAVALKESLTGLEWAAGLPGTIGGAVANNSGCNGGSTSNIISWVTYLENGSVVEYPVIDDDFRYRSSVFKDNPEKIILELRLKRLRKDDHDKIKIRMNEFLEKRSATQPQGQTVGCIFKNHESFSAGLLIDQAGLKGLQIGKAKVSDKHANFILNLDDSATASDVMKVITAVSYKVKKKFGIELEKEIYCLGKF